MLKILKLLNIGVLVSKVPLKWKYMLKYLILHKHNVINLLQTGSKIFVLMAADYGNLGDIAITEVQMDFLKENFPSHEIIPIFVKEMCLLFALKKSISRNDIITIIGGGNMGDVYQGLENQRRYIIQSFPHNKIISFPQSFDFKNKRNLRKSIKIYSRHTNLHIFAREPQSYEMMKKNFKSNNVYLVPDIVLYDNKCAPKVKRDGILLCLRNDLEKKIANDQQESLISSIHSKYLSLRQYDTSIDNFEKDMAAQELNKIWNAFKMSQVVITDRLHGMIFSAITNTPCVVLPNTNHKIASTYEKWLSDIDFIIFVEEFNEELILSHIETLAKLEINNENNSINCRDHYLPLLNALKN